MTEIAKDSDYSAVIKLIKNNYIKILVFKI